MSQAAKQQATGQQKDLAYAILLLERQLESYQRLHEEEMAAIRQALDELKKRVLALGDQKNAVAGDTDLNPRESVKEISGQLKEE